MVETSTRSLKKPQRGGAPNLLLVCASIEAPPEPLLGVADELHVLMPWGRLLAGTVRGDADVLGGLRAIARPDATLRIVIGTQIWSPPVPREVAELPEPTDAYVAGPLAQCYATWRWALDGARRLTADEARRELPTSWTRRLAGPALEIRAVAS